LHGRQVDCEDAVHPEGYCRAGIECVIEIKLLQRLAVEETLDGSDGGLTSLSGTAVNQIQKGRVAACNAIRLPLSGDVSKAVVCLVR
jgi:hypothetical protein